MARCQHQWEMTDIHFGFIVFERCSHCRSLRTYFTKDARFPMEDEYREGDCYYNVVENAQSIQFDLKCMKCNQIVKFDELMGFLHCTGCLPDCKIDKLRIKLEAQKTWIVVAFGFFPVLTREPIPARKLDILTEFFNQRRDTARSTIKVLSFKQIQDFARCRGDFIHDVGMLSQEPPEQRKPVFT